MFLGGILPSPNAAGGAGGLAILLIAGGWTLLLRSRRGWLRPLGAWTMAAGVWLLLLIA